MIIDNDIDHSWNESEIDQCWNQYIGPENCKWIRKHTEVDAISKTTVKT